MADNEKDNSSYVNPFEFEPGEFTPADVSEPQESGFDYLDLMPDDFEPIDVSEPRAPRKEMEVIEEALAERRRDWIRSHIVYIYAVVGVIVVALIALGVHIYYQSSNPMSRFSSAVSKDFDTSFDFVVKLTEDGEDRMQYNGSVEVNRSRHMIEALYDADYGGYTFTGAVYADDTTAMRGSLYNEKWTVHDCTDRVQDFFDFDRSFRSGGFNGGAFLRFTELTSDYSTRELESFVGVLKNRMSTDSTIAEVSSEKTDSGTRYDYDINLYELFSMVQKDGASVFYRASDYDKFSAAFEANQKMIENAACTMSFVINSAGYLTSFDMSVTVAGTQYGLSCRMSNFGSADAEMPQDFLKAAALQAVQE